MPIGQHKYLLLVYSHDFQLLSNDMFTIHIVRKNSKLYERKTKLFLICNFQLQSINAGGNGIVEIANRQVFHFVPLLNFTL